MGALASGRSWLPRRRRVTERATPTMLQLQETECGVVSLAIVLAFHDAWVPLPELRERCGVDGHGTNAATLLQAATSYGLDARALRLDVDQLRHLGTLAILFWQQRHFVVLERIQGDRAWINDPATGRRELSLDELESGYSGIAFPMQPGDEFAPRGAPPKLGRALQRAVRPARSWLVALIVTVVLETVAVVLAVFLLGGLVDGWIGGERMDWGPFAVAGTAALLARGAHVLIVDRAILAIARPRLHVFLDDMRYVSRRFLGLRQPAELAGRLRLAEFMGSASTHVVVASVRLCCGCVAWLAMLWQIGVPVAATFAGAVAGTMVLAHRRETATAGSPDGAQRAEMRRAGAALDLWRQRVRIQANGEEAVALSRAVIETHYVEPVERRRSALAFGRDVLAGGVLMLVPVAGVLVAGNAATIGDSLVTALACWYGMGLALLPATLLRFLGTLPVTVTQLGDSEAERAWMMREHVA